MVFVSNRPFSAFLENGFRQRVGRVLYHFIMSEKISKLVYVWWNNEPRFRETDMDHLPIDYKKVLLVESTRVQLPFARTLGLSIDALDRLRIKKLTNRLDILAGEMPWVWATDPRLCCQMREITDRIGGSLAYDLIDNFALVDSLSKEERELFRLGYEAVMVSADRIFANNAHTGDFFRAPKDKFRCVKNGVDWNTFHAAIGSEDPVELKNIKHPRVGFVGILSSVTDTQLLNRIAKEIPECEVVYIGPYGDESDTLNPYIHCLGKKSFQVIPQYMASFDVGLSIYRESPATRFGNSQKVYEYLSVGCPVVATNAQDYRRISSFVRVASGNDEFIQLVREALVEPNNRELCEARSQSVRAYDWRFRIDEIFNFLGVTGK
jgi:glycosyltransferase involved in cell wall biosynthesis